MDGNVIFILKGMKLTVNLYVVTMLFSLPLGILLSLGRVSKNTTLSNMIQVYTWVFRGTPLLLQLFFVYYGLPVVGITLTPFAAASLTFVINYTAYFCEIFRGSILGIDPGQYEAAKVLGMKYWQTMIRIIIPQALITALPPLSNEAISLIKDTSLVSAIGMAEILRNSRELVTRDFSITPFFICAVVYLGLSTIVVIFFKRMEKKVMI
ncbi:MULTISPECIES: amino acid ABC transporter permease [Fusobacterium]|jgi:polar amino acid transport system permease protein|uniref:Inner membrane amino-acid ABC transporter permease protein yecS n=2 Tax=Fusobacterium ulcerans TaxID=861 RepID=A0AAX1TNU9_9FUSO|nr:MULTISPECIES: amino acid ABC transporter permease [Fusobacterium]AVQ29307.1 amino acid ABC transporter permease [Fusobacterium ulcerans]EFS27280.1 His/Glu/Gln/Arg/opine family amino ABC transporter, permease, 3-TM region [Fusobacterium ulcerans ATCC 49185]EHO81287.1 His/Glu/Gln/Arg/opine family amino ABC transporter, permease, 3-TM region [Fusobacterium ulcerans 12-1B]MCB8565425.1 amino acid ABC transporter permease [Fusobacterium ulcerans]MCB8649428.1 amino acid ABC transporter permease [F